MREAIMVPGAVSPAGHYSHAVIANGFVFVAGQGPADPATRKVTGTFREQVRRTIENIRTILNGAGADLGDMVKVTVFLSDIALFREYDAVYREMVPEGPAARTTVAAMLNNIDIEIDCIAVLPQRPSD
ncbi:RidA family protein [Mesorhizobium australicum]|uniref:2-iminobutanoate/2-iminopropanoate deaminase n=1 Tax=Mesorhizobium australicum TaxID=536018 RepID=A0A1X7MXT3_9HYPH|nr:RidA family protein [Mesorhizobium australicum]SMH29605.1 2-iminobutanoate/2-iminopropanoate deaminase [Mesorhizobium australicum]